MNELYKIHTRIENGKVEEYYKYSPISCEHPVIIQSKSFYDNLLYCRNVYLGHYSHEVSYDEVRLIQDTMKSDKYIKQYSKRKLGVTLENYMDFYCFSPVTGETFPMFQVVPCGKCRLCRNRKVSEWQTRSFAEVQTSGYNPLFITLTYNNENLPENKSISKEELQKFIKRLREHFKRLWNYNGSLRYIACGEYGHISNRPHYHLLLFSYPFIECWNDLIEEIESCWTFGFSYTKLCINSDASRYICKYIKKDVSSDFIDSDREKPFFLSSRRMGIGYDWISSHIEEMRNTPLYNTIQIRDNSTGKIKEFFMPQYFREKIWPTLSRIVPKDVRDYFFNFLHLGRKIIQCRYNANRFSYDDVTQKLTQIGYKFDFLSSCFSGFMDELKELFKPIEYDGKIVIPNPDYKYYEIEFNSLFDILSNINLPIVNIRRYLALLARYKSHFLSYDFEPIDIQSKVGNLQKQIDLEIQREKL